MYKKTLILLTLFLIFIIYNFDFCRKIINSNLFIIGWLIKNPDFKTYKDNIIKHGVFKYFYSLDKNNIHYHKMPLYEGVLINKMEELNYTNYELFNKKNSLAQNINDFTTPLKLNGSFKGDSLFRKNYKDRGHNNLLKEKYLMGMRPNLLILYRKRINSYLLELGKKLKNENIKYNYYNFIRKLVIDITYLLHFNSLPSKKEINDFDIFTEAIAFMPYNYIYNRKVLKQIYNLKYANIRALKRINKIKNDLSKNIKNNCIVEEWIISKGFNDEDIIIEFVHNLLGMGINWINLLYSYIKDIDSKNIPRLDINKNYQYRRNYIYESFRFICPAMFATSNIKMNNKNYQVIHDLMTPTRNINYFGNDTEVFNVNRHNDNHSNMNNPTNINVLSKDNKKCPFYTTKNLEKVFKGQELYTNEGYSVFGKGYRRCPGEFVSMIFMEEIALFISPLQFSITLKNNISNKVPYVWDEIEKNYIIEFL